ncbi:ABC transporter permease [Chengkuizengella sediminis]|uniref:ABC transporter permease n=1 Tax=Chengkuizengella sediminis TaxID=1885917 RepID=UPI00138987CD|nr:ABC transporter permease [Chengkuizengella sediminis]NDI37152.1 ABC transporter permease [Chengkuizengella sediminis]
MKMSDVWNKRFKDFWAEVSPYLRFVLNGGLIAFVVISFSIGSIYYRRFIENPPVDFPIHLLLTCVLFWFIAYSPIRTYLREADLIYLVPAEYKMNSYFNKAIFVSFLVQSFVLILIWVVLFPLYLVTSDTNSLMFFVYLIVLMIIKWILMYGSWQEVQFQADNHRVVFSFFRWIISFCVLYAVFSYSFPKGMLFIAFVLMTYIISFRLIPKYQINWDRLIHVEKQHKARIYAFLSWFVDVPQLPKRVKNRKILSKSVKFVPFEKNNTFVFLYYLTWIRTDLFGIVVRMTVIGMILIFFLTNDWMKYLFYIIIIYLTGMQLSSLRQYHKNMFWLYIYPLQNERRVEGILKNSFRIHLVIIIMMTIPFILTISNILYGFILLAVSILLSYMYHQSLSKKMLKGKE